MSYQKAFIFGPLLVQRSSVTLGWGFRSCSVTMWQIFFFFFFFFCKRHAQNHVSYAVDQHSLLFSIISIQTWKWKHSVPLGWVCFFCCCFFFFKQNVLIFFLFLHESICWYSLEVPHWGTSNEYPQQMLSWKKKKKNYPISSTTVCFSEHLYPYMNGPKYLQVLIHWNHKVAAL